jgi:hypothetical protein
MGVIARKFSGLFALFQQSEALRPLVRSIIRADRRGAISYNLRTREAPIAKPALPPFK